MCSIDQFGVKLPNTNSTKINPESIHRFPGHTDEQHESRVKLIERRLNIHRQNLFINYIKEFVKNFHLEYKSGGTFTPSTFGLSQHEGNEIVLNFIENELAQFYLGLLHLKTTEDEDHGVKSGTRFGRVGP